MLILLLRENVHNFIAIFIYENAHNSFDCMMKYLNDKSFPALFLG